MAQTDVSRGAKELANAKAGQTGLFWAVGLFSAS